MTFAHGISVFRQRPKMVTDRYSGKQVPGSWDDPDELELPGAWVAQSSTSRLTTASRTQLLESKSLFCDPDADVLASDRIRVGSTIYPIEGIPEADWNPFTGWRPYREVPLGRVIG